ncbi:MAG TPA: response regulator [Candidatus Binatia bacterium]
MILFVEDDSLSRRAFAQLLRAEGYQVAEAGNGAQALEILSMGAEVLSNEVFDLVIADLVLPGVHGVNLVHQIRARWPKMPIIIISGYLSGAPGKVILEGFAEFIQKPLEPAELIAAVRRLLTAKV